VIVTYLNPSSLLGYWYFLAIGLLFFSLFDRSELKDFAQAYLINGFLTALYVLAQVHFYPESVGCTSPLGLQTDDSYFFSLVADDIPPDLETREGYFLYTSGFSDLVRFITPFRVTHPLDVLFFLSIVAGLICVYTQQYALQLTGDKKVARTAYILCQFCPLMLMNGGAVFVRDTFVGGLLILSLCCINRRRFFAFVCCTLLQFVLRPGTALIILPLYSLIHVGDVFTGLKSQEARVRFAFTALILAGTVAAVFLWREQLEDLLETQGIRLSEFRREGLDDVLMGSGRGTFMWVQEQSLLVRILLATAYMYLVPFLALTGLVTQYGFDSRFLLMNIVYPLWVIPIHAWVIASLFTKQKSSADLRWMALAFLVGCFLIGAFSLQSRHKVIIQPLLYVLAAAGCHLAPREARRAGYVFSALWFAFQSGYAIYRMYQGE